ncbi:uncharacterized protein LOC132308543 [Cornus florida]|uniref:uncharacterized protein LOC132308543 n=1 Tax=Cornus florida TaxID=4283 RepID=UPI0028A05636|nr:uncharacterized protein LOC132308543 [Cornus florida]
MAKHRNRTPEEEKQAANGASSKGKRKLVEEEDGSKSQSEPEDGSRGSEEEGARSRSSKKRSRSSKRKSRSKYSDDDNDSYSSSSGDDYSDSDSESSEYSSEESESEEERKRRKRRERRRREERERASRRKRKREKEKEREKKRRRKKEVGEEKKKKKKKDKKREKDKGKKGAVTDSWGKYGIIRETDMWNKRPEFTAWLAEVKQVNLESLRNLEEKQMFKQFMEDHNTGTFPSKKYYDLDAYHRRKIEKSIKKGFKQVLEKERTVFNDEEQRRQELLQEREKHKEEQVEVLKRSMQSGMAQAMKEQALLREEMALQYKLGNFEAAAAIQRRLDPDVAM